MHRTVTFSPVSHLVPSNCGFSVPFQSKQGWRGWLPESLYPEQPSDCRKASPLPCGYECHYRGDWTYCKGGVSLTIVKRPVAFVLLAVTGLVLLTKLIFDWMEARLAHRRSLRLPLSPQAGEKQTGQLSRRLVSGGEGIAESRGQ